MFYSRFVFSKPLNKIGMCSLICMCSTIGYNSQKRSYAYKLHFDCKENDRKQPKQIK